MPHQSTENYTLDGYHVPTGTRLIINIPNPYRDPHVWSDPNEFRPERFLTTRMLMLGAKFQILTI